MGERKRKAGACLLCPFKNFWDQAIKMNSRHRTVTAVMMVALPSPDAETKENKGITQIKV